MNTPTKEEEFWEQQTECYREIFEAGGANALLALYNAVKYYQTMKPVPKWIARAVQTMIMERHFESSGTGHYGSDKERLNMDYAHFLRWRAVRAVLTIHGLETLPEGKPGRPRKDDPATRRTPLLREALAMLKGNRLARYATPEQVAESFAIVEASMAAGEARFRFPDFIEV